MRHLPHLAFAYKSRFGQISFLLFAGSALLGVHFGAGRHLGDISESGRVNAIMVRTKPSS